MGDRSDQMALVEALDANRYFPMSRDRFADATGMTVDRVRRAGEALCNQGVFAIYLRDAGGYCFTERGQRQWEALQRAPVRHL